MKTGYLRNDEPLPILGKGLTESDISTNTNLGTSDEKIPSQNAVKEYVDDNAGGVSVNVTMAYIASKY
jgi:hypothetical protein